MEQELVLNRMYSGDYLLSNLGHEVINVYESDNEGYLLYLNPKGSFHRKHKDKVRQMVLVRSTSYKSCVEVIGIAEGLSDVPFDTESQNALVDNATYGGVTLAQLFGSNESKQDCYVTFRAERVLRPNVPTYIVFKGGTTLLDSNKAVSVIHLESEQGKTTLKQYFSEGSCDYKALQERLFAGFSGTPMPKVDIAEMQKPAAKNFFEVCGIDNSELAFSNAFAYFLETYPDMLKQFAAMRGHNVDCSSLTVTRETEENIDLYVETPSHIIVVENKVLSDINGREHAKTKGESQLAKYYQHVEGKKDKRKKLYVVLTPDHNNIDLRQFDYGDKYAKLFYSEVRQFLIGYVEREKLQADRYLWELIAAMEKHSQKFYNALYARTKRLFYDTIKSKCK